ncbi:MAG: hypothetical protein ACLUFN_06825 [Eubacterium sp.]
MEKYLKPQTKVEEFDSIDVLTASVGDIPSAGGDNDTPFEPV